MRIVLQTPRILRLRESPPRGILRATAIPSFMLIFWVAVVNVRDGAEITLANFLHLLAVAGPPALGLFLFFNLLYQLRNIRRRTFVFDATTRELTARTMTGKVYRTIRFADIASVAVEKDEDKPWYRIVLELRDGERFYPSRRWYDTEDRLPEVKDAIVKIVNAS